MSVTGAASTYTEHGAAVPLASSVIVTDSDSGGDLTSATVSISGPILTDMLNFTNQNGITGSYNVAQGELTLTGSTSIANYETALQSITYSSSGDPTGGGSEPDRSIFWEVNDGVANSAVQDTLLSSDTAPCYCRGVLIRTGHGDMPVEDPAIGDTVITAGGKVQPIKWIGRRSYAGRFVLGRKDILPVCIKTGSLGENVPQRDLWVSPHHAMYFEGERSGVLIEAKDLVNGVSIVQAEQIEEVEYFHIELDRHDVIIAEGALSETFIDADSRSMFHNAHEYAARYPENARRPARYYAQRLDIRYEVEAIRQRLATRVGLGSAEQDAGELRGYIDAVSPRLIEGWAQSVCYPEAPVCLDIYAGGQLIGQTLANRFRKDLEVAGPGNGRHSFSFTRPEGLMLLPRTIEVRRSLDGARLPASGELSVARGTRRAS